MRGGRRNSEASDWMGGMTMNGGLAQRSFTAVMFITKLICLWVQGRAYIRNREQGNVSRECAWTLWGRAFAGERMQAHGRMRRDWVT